MSFQYSDFNFWFIYFYISVYFKSKNIHPIFKRNLSRYLCFRTFSRCHLLLVSLIFPVFVTNLCTEHISTICWSSCISGLFKYFTSVFILYFHTLLWGISASVQLNDLGNWLFFVIYSSFKLKSLLVYYVMYVLMSL